MIRICTVLLLTLGLTSVTADKDLYQSLQGIWVDTSKEWDEVDVISFIYFHKSGRYISMIDAGALSNIVFWITVQERGDWSINHQKLELRNREFSDKIDPVSLISLKQLSNTTLSLEFCRNGNKWVNDYVRKKPSCRQMQRFGGVMSMKKKLTIPCREQFLLKIIYHSFEDYVEKPVELILQNKAGDELWKKSVIFKEEKQEEEILLADLPSYIELTELLLVVNIASDCLWEMQVKFY